MHVPPYNYTAITSLIFSALKLSGVGLAHYADAPSANAYPARNCVTEIDTVERGTRLTTTVCGPGHFYRPNHIPTRAGANTTLTQHELFIVT